MKEGFNQPKGVHVTTNTATNTAAQVDPLDAFVQEIVDQDSNEVSTGEPQAESATAPEVKTTDTEKPTSTDAEKPKEDGFQKRVNKLTKDKFAEKKRADELQQRLDDIEAAKAKEALKKPRLDDPEIDYDEEAFNKANIDYEVKKGVQDALEVQSEAAKAKLKQEAAEAEFNTFAERVTALGKDDFEQKASAIPILPDGVAAALMQSEQGAEMIYHLGSNLDKAQELANMTPAMAMMELGKISTKLSVKPEIKTSAAPDPIEPVKAGSALSSEIGDNGLSIDDWMKKFN